MFVPIVKVDAERRLVYGRATDETPDAQGEVMDYNSSKSQFMRWSQEQSEASGGRSLGNLRSMHGQIAAGLIKDIQFDDHAKAIDVVARVVDDNEWQKVLEGVHTGFSIGGRYLRRWPDVVGDQAVMRYTAAPAEISLVDSPANIRARFFEIHKGGSVRRQAFKSNEEFNMFIPRDENHCGRSTAAGIIKALQGKPSGDLAQAFGKCTAAPRAGLLQGVSARLEKQLAKAGMRIRGPVTAGVNGVQSDSIDAFKSIHVAGPRKASPISVPPQSTNAAPAPRATRADLGGGYPEYHTPTYEAPPLLGPPQSASESAPTLPPGSRDQYDPTVAAIRGIHRQGPQRGYLR
jgi:hypothetical protein